jgi:membrane fusion protein (multidrug efflux system)
MKRKVSLILAALVVGAIAVSLPACARMKADEGGEGHEGHEPQHTIVVTSPESKDVVVTQPYVCQIHSRRHVEIKALEEGYLEEIDVKEGQTVKQGQIMFRVFPPIYRAELATAQAEAKYAAIKLENTKRLNAQKIVSDQEVALYEAELAKANARVQLAEAQFKFTEVKAPFDGIMDRQLHQQGSLVKKDEVLTTLSDNHLMWVYFNVPEARYLEYEVSRVDDKNRNVSQLTLKDSRIELKLANGSIFPHSAGNTVTVEGNFNNKTGNIPFRADFRNPELLLRHGQTGTVLVHHTLHNAVVIPQRATFEFLDKQYVWVVGEDNAVHRRLITIENEVEDAFVIKSGLDVKEKIIVEGVRQVHDGDKIEYEFKKPEEVLKHQKNPAE